MTPRRPLLVNARGYPVEEVETACGCGPEFLPAARHFDGSRKGRIWERLPPGTLNALDFEFELPQEVGRLPRLRRRAPTSLGPKEVVSKQRFVGRGKTCHPVRLVVIGARMAALVRQFEGGRKTKNTDVCFVPTYPLSMRELRELRRLNRFLRGARLVVLLVSIDEHAEGCALLQAAFALWRLRTPPAASLLVLWDQGEGNMALWPTLPSLPGSQVSMALPTAQVEAAVEATSKSKEPGRLWTLVHQQSWGLLRQVPHSR